MPHLPLFRSLIPELLEDRLQEGIRHALSQGADGAEAFVSVSRSSKAKVQNGVLEDLTTSKRGGLGVRVMRGGRTGLATTTDLGRDDFRDLFSQAGALAEVGDVDPWLRQADPAGTDDLPSRYDPEVAQLTPEWRMAKALELEAHARSASPQVCAVREASWRDGVGASLLLTQRGIRCADLASSCSASIDLAVASDQDRQAGWHWEVARHPQGVDLQRIGRLAAEKGLQKLDPRQLPAGRYAVVLHPEVTVDLLGVIAGMLSAEEVIKNRSLFEGKLNQLISSRQLTLVDDGRLVGGLGTTPWDGEGLPTRRNVLIEQGCLRSYLHTLRTAAELGQPSTASAGRGVGSNPGITTFNLQPLPGTAAPEALLKEAGDGVLLTEIMGLHTVDPVSGDLSVGASGVRIRNGVLAESVDRMTFAGNLKDLLQGIAGVGADLTWYGSSAGVSLLLDPVALGGC